MAEDKESKPQPRKVDEVIRIKDLTPRDDVKGGRKIVLGEKDESGESAPE